MTKVTQHLSKQIKAKKSYNYLYLCKLCLAVVFLYTPGILNTNIEQEESFEYFIKSSNHPFGDSFDKNCHRNFGFCSTSKP